MTHSKSLIGVHIETQSPYIVDHMYYAISANTDTPSKANDIVTDQTECPKNHETVQEQDITNTLVTTNYFYIIYFIIPPTSSPPNISAHPRESCGGNSSSSVTDICKPPSL